MFFFLTCFHYEEKFGETKGKAQTNMNILTEAIFKKEQSAAKEEEWRMAAIVINRGCMLIYIVTIVVTSGVVLMTVPRARSGNL